MSPFSAASEPGAESQWDFEPIKAKLAFCVAHHSCGGAVDAPLPTRLLDVGGPDPSRVRLAVTAAEEIKGGRYAALSYVWGQHNTSMTTPATLDRRLQGFRLDELPRTIRDAVQATRDLACRYLWVDALCILQGPTAEAQADWEREAATMEATYSNALFTIAAAAAEHCDAGLFPSPPAVLAPKGTTWNPPVDGRWFKDEPLNSRAWALQEWLLSYRLVTFTSRGTFFHCLTSGLFYDISKDDIGDFYHVALASATPHELDVIWDKMVSNYTSRSLTNPADKLPAIAGLARRFDHGRSGRYLAGLWEASLTMDLLWHRGDAFRPALPRPRVSGSATTYRAPSWSWAAVDGTVAHVFRPAETVPLAEVIECTTGLATADPYGSVSSGRLVVRGPCKMGTRLEHDVRGVVTLNAGEVAIAMVYLDDRRGSARVGVEREGTLFGLLVEKVLLGPVYWGILLVEAGHENTDEDQRLFRRIGAFFFSQAPQVEWWKDAVRRHFVVI